MKKLIYLIVLAVFLSFLTGCGTLSSIDKKMSYVQWAKIAVSDSLSVKGQIVNLNDSVIIISVNGAVVEYNQKDILGYQKYMAPDPDLVQRDIARNSKTTAGNTGFFVFVTMVGFIASLILVLQ